MPIIDLQKSLRRLGKIRMGDQQPTQGGKTRPAKLSEWRITSPNRELLERAADIYGGEPRVWAGAPGEGREFELYTNADTLRVVVPGDFSFSQWYEAWSAGGCQRRCDGVTEQLSEKPCMCPADQDERAEQAKFGKACKMTTRLSVLLPDVPDIGVWMLESHGYYAAVELAGAHEIFAQANGRMVPAQLRIEQRTVKRGNETRRFAVPVLELTTVTAGMLLTGEAPASLASGARAAIGTGADDTRGPEAQPVTSQGRGTSPRADGSTSPRGAQPPPPPPSGGQVRTDWMSRINAIADTREKRACMEAFKDAFGAPPWHDVDEEVAARTLAAFEKATSSEPPLPGEIGEDDPAEQERRRRAVMATSTKAFASHVDGLKGKAKTDRLDLLRHAAVVVVLGRPASTMQMTVGELRKVEAFLGGLVDGSDVSPTSFEVLEDGIVRVRRGDQVLDISADGAVAAVAS